MSDAEGVRLVSENPSGGLFMERERKKRIPPVSWPNLTRHSWGDAMTGAEDVLRALEGP